MNTEEEALAKERVVQKLFRLYRSMDGKANRALIDAYLEPIASYSASAAQQAFERFRDNEVDGAELDWLPGVPRWVSQVKMLDGILQRVQRGGDGLVAYKIGAEPPEGYEALGPVSVDIGHGMIDLTGKTLAEKEAILKGEHPEHKKIEGFTMPRIKRMTGK